MATHKIILGRVAKSDGRAEVQLQIIHERLHREIDIGFRIEPQYFDKHKVLKTHPLANKMNEKISTATLAADAVIVDHAGEYIGIDQLKLLVISRMNYQGKSPQLSEYIEHIHTLYIQRGQRVSAKQIKMICSYFDKFTEGKLQVHQIREDLLMNWRNSLERAGRSPNTIQTYLTILKMLWKQAVKDGHISKLRDSPFNPNMLPGWHEGPKKAHEPKVIKQMAEGLSALSDKQKTALECRILQLCIQGIDVIDLARLKKSMIVNDRITLPFRHKNRRKKKRNQYTVHITPEAYLIINKYECDAFLPMFQDLDIDSEQYVAVRNAVYNNAVRACKVLGIENIGAKSMRHTWATMAELLSENNFILPKMGLGHSIGDMTAKYVNIRQERIDQLNRDVIKNALK